MWEEIVKNVALPPELLRPLSTCGVRWLGPSSKVRKAIFLFLGWVWGLSIQSCTVFAA